MFFFLQDFRVGPPVVDEDEDGLVVVVGAWLVEGEGSPSLAAAEGRPRNFGLRVVPRKSWSKWSLRPSRILPRYVAPRRSLGHHDQV